MKICKIKDTRAFVIFLLLSACFWQFCCTLSNILIKNFTNDPFVTIAVTENRGAAFGILNNSPYILGVFGVLVILVVCFYVLRNVTFSDKWKLLFFSVFTAGILGNTAERFLNGFVLDFIKIKGVDFPVFNLYDILISTSVFLYVFCYLKNGIKRSKN